MPLAPGTRLGPYEVVAPLGEGGMGEVYRARDTKLDRAVAIKILPESFAHDLDRLARFEREAKTLAALNHPNIATIHGFQDGALVMELVEGSTLAERIARGPIAMEDALEIAKQIANALEAAHEQGIIHRDLKPANIKLRPDGTVKVLDFGLAKMLEREIGVTGGATQVSQSPTITSPALMTGAGIILGTAAYMSPEQAKGRPADKRSDLWAFGSVLYEMLTGTRPFVAEDVSDTLALVLTKEPDWSALPAALPATIRTLLRRCLTKDRRRRLDSAADARLEIDDALTAPTAAPATTDTHRSVAGVTLRHYAVAGAVVLVAALAAGYAGWTFNRVTPRVPARFEILLDAGHGFTPGRQWIALSPDGRHLAYAANNRIYLRALGDLDAKSLVGSDDIAVQSTPRTPFFSPDSQWIGFWHAGQLKKMSVSGGAPVTVSTLELSPNGASWAADDTILVASPTTGIWRLPARGGELQQIITIESGQRAYGPQLLPDGRTVLFTFAANPGSWDDAEIVVQSVDGGPRQTLVTGSDGRYLPTGHIVYGIRSTVLAVPFDANTLRVTGVPVPVIEGVRRQTIGNAASQFAVAASGTLAYVPALGATGAMRTLVWVDRGGREEATSAQPDRYISLRLAPDGIRAALDTISDDNRDIWVWDSARGTRTRVTSDPTADAQPVWTPEGKRVIFSTDRTATGTSLFWQPPDGSAAAERVLEGRGAIAYTMHGSSLIVRGVDGRGASDLMILGLDEDGPVRSDSRLVLKPITKTPFEESNAAFSPDGRWLAYQSNSSSRFEVYVQPFPSGRQLLVSTGGGGEPVWGPDNRELFYRSPDGAVMRVAISDSTPLTASTPTRLFAGSSYAVAGRSYFLNTYDISPDGKRFLMMKNGERTDRAPTVERIIVVQDWLEELTAKVRR